jgi:hypothetical protein
MRRCHLARLALACVLVFAGSAAQGTPFVVTFSGTITSVDPNLASQFTVGQPVSGSFAFDSAAIDQIPANTQIGQYIATNATLQIGSESYGDANAAIIIDDGTAPGDQYELVADSLTGNPVGAFAPQFWELHLQDSSASVYSDDSLPTSLDLTDFDNTFVLLRFGDGASTFADLTASVDSIAVVPEPASALLLLGALARLARHASRSARRARE